MSTSFSPGSLRPPGPHGPRLIDIGIAPEFRQYQAPGWVGGRSCLELICALRQTVGKLGCQLESLVLLDLVLGHELGKEAAVHPPRHIVSRGYRKKCPRVVVEADRVVEAGSLRGLLAKTLHALGAVVEPPW